MTEARDRQRASYQVLVATLWLTLLVLAVKVWAGLATRSLSLLAESLHTLIDSFSIVLSLVAVASPQKKTGREIWSHGKRVAAAALVLVAVVGFFGLNLSIAAIDQLKSALNGLPLASVQVNLPLVHLVGVVVAINLCLVLFERYEARVLESIALRINANHVLHDAWLTILVLMGLVGVAWGYVWLDALMAIALVLMSIGSSWRMFNWQLPLMVQPTAIAPEILAQIAYQIEGVTHCYRVRSQGIVGRQLFVEMRLVLHPDCLGSARLIIERIEMALRERYGPVHASIRIGDKPGKSDLRSPSMPLNRIRDRYD